MIKTLWRYLRDLLDPYYELSPVESERLIVIRSHYQNALWSMERIRDDLQAEIFYLNSKIQRIDQQLEDYPDEFP